MCRIQLEWPLLVLLLCSVQRPLEAAEPIQTSRSKEDTAWTSLFNGKNLDGWIVKCRPEDRDKIGYWKVVDGTITAETPSGSKHNYIWLLTDLGSWCSPARPNNAARALLGD